MTETKSNAVRQFLTFIVGNECFGIDVMRIRGVVEVMPITRVPAMPRGLRGVVNLRGAVVPVVDLGVRLGCDELGVTKWSCIVITSLELQGETMSVGLLVDTVRQVIDLPESEINPVPALGARKEVELVEGMGTVDSSFVLILDVDRILDVEGWSPSTELLRSEVQDAPSDESPPACEDAPPDETPPSDEAPLLDATQSSLS